ncbi:hypothetical protein TPAU25S_00114 [Tsukamurella paurometabola]|uniref:DUF2127 domain-containing protein n=1 Tax=Tsukamurella paurometabola (strain ATCC 8368 / DSM 20162 / CCUG 35730 / CIP 100753 / JCM 10117 / KCTC 9821 / NBRC 16120 / NCIMB 702349 / NCTC 13040) TaxID=521096 RepID=D5USN6_TSUPD|nr:DUF2127 domain-containing protein [Tsukamurella paurometabola]ADG79307.1 Protein of unknown function DUF2068, transmembrane [Tsukamurella paurometabola DSM 20162]SUP35015.1 Predicted membrane protein (DUF2127) [Tsukamurella paurometabola]
MNLSVLWCGVRGHVTYAPDEGDLRGRIHAETPEGSAWRCLRCDDYVVGEPVGSGPAAEAPTVPRGRALRDELIMRFLAVERFLRGLVFVAAGFAVWKVRDSRGHLREIFDSELPVLRALGEQLGWNPDDSRIIRALDQALDLSGTTLLWVAAGLFAYAVIEFVEAVGLWRGARWGEYFAVIATSAFLPLEIYEISEKVTVLRAGALLVNIAAVAWLLWSKRLFGLNGGAEAYYAERQSESVLTVRRAGQ